MSKSLCFVATVVCVGVASPTFASHLIYLRPSNQLVLRDAKGNGIGQWQAFNNVVQGAQPFPNGKHHFSHYKTHDDDGPDSAYGSYGIFVFDVHGRTGMGLHSGRANAPNSPGPKHPTEGCIRTTDEAMRKILEVHNRDPITDITVAQ